ncbi:MAG: LpxI family protein [Alphaproteobacteria bacterium]|nr:MAG: LpxI family protein [Alphaproteobacteria bacterium]
MSDGSLAIIAGSGVLPRMIAEARAAEGAERLVVEFEGVPVGSWAEAHPRLRLPFEKPGRLFSELRKAGCTEVTFAGGMQRPRLRPLHFDLTALRLATRILPMLRQGDDALLRSLASVFEAEGFSVTAPHAYLEGLLAAEGVPSRVKPSEEDRSDAARAAGLVAGIGALDVGQAAVVAQGICLGLETVQGTDALIDFVAATRAGFAHDPGGGRGVLLKAPKPGQDWRVDLPAIGPETLRRAARAGLSGVAVQAGGVLILGLEETVAAADEEGLFLWGRRAEG